MQPRRRPPPRHRTARQTRAPGLPGSTRRRAAVARLTLALPTRPHAVSTVRTHARAHSRTHARIQGGGKEAPSTTRRRYKSPRASLKFFLDMPTAAAIWSGLDLSPASVSVRQPPRLPPAPLHSRPHHHPPAHRAEAKNDSALLEYAYTWARTGSEARWQGGAWAMGREGGRAPSGSESPLSSKALTMVRAPSWIRCRVLRRGPTRPVSKLLVSTRRHHAAAVCVCARAREEGALPA